MKKVLFTILIFSFFISAAQKGKVKSAFKIIQKGHYSVYYDTSGWHKWKMKWIKINKKGKFQNFKGAFTTQAGKILGSQLEVLKDYIYKADEFRTEKQQKFLTSNLNFVLKYNPKFLEDTIIKDLNFKYLEQSVNLSKIVAARFLLQNRNYNAWYQKWKEIPTEEAFQKDSLIEQSKIVFKDLLNQLDNYINKGDEENTDKLRNTIQTYYNFVRNKVPNYDKQVSINHLSDNYLSESVDYAKINKAQQYCDKNLYEKWIGKWEELAPLDKAFKKDAMEKQSLELFTKLKDIIEEAQRSENYNKLEEYSELTYKILKRTLKIYPEFQTVKSQRNDLYIIDLDYLKNAKINSKINIAYKALLAKDYESWLDKWLQIQRENAYNQSIIEQFNNQADKVFDMLIDDLKHNAIDGNILKTKQLADLTKKMWKSEVLRINPNYEFKNKDLNDIFLNHITDLAVAYSEVKKKNYFEAVNNLLKKLSENVNSPEFKDYFSKFYEYTLQQLTQDYYYAHASHNFKAINAFLLEIYNTYNLKPQSLTLNYVPEIFNENKKYRTFKAWLDSRFNSELNFYYSQADSLISHNLYVDAYKFIFEYAVEISKTSKAQQKINSYHNLFETKGTDYYKSVINRLINNNLYLLALNVLNNQLLYINPDFKTTRLAEYKTILNKIKENGKDYYLRLRNLYLADEDYHQAHLYCDSISYINKDFNYKKCHDEIVFARLYDKIETLYMDNGKYFCAIDSVERLLRLEVDNSLKIEAEKLKKEAQDKAKLTVSIAVFLDYSFPKTEAYVRQKIYNYLQAYDYPYSSYIRFVSNDLSSYQYDILNNEARNYKQSHPDVDLLIIFNLENFDYDYDWYETSTGYLCKKEHKQETKRVRKTRRVRKTVIINGKTYYIMERPDGWQFKAYYDENGFLHCITDEGNDIIYPTNLWGPPSYVYEDEVYYENVQVDEYRYNRVSYKIKKGREFMKFNAYIQLNDIRSEAYTLHIDNKEFSSAQEYEKYDKPNYYNLDDLCKCPSNIPYNTWIEDNYVCYDFDKDPFYAPSNPFLGKDKFYNSFLDRQLDDYLRGQLSNVLNKIISIHRQMECN